MNDHYSLPAFPLTEEWCDANRNGMHLRDYFAAKALQGQIAFEGMEGCDPEHIAGMCYELADAMIKHRSGTTNA